ncbi:RxLR effector protein [Phytophthora megakarya]|uniref:RxLR effector protein n=1 Tax=Phytophthora megakarya TaxID=4795 RepID=A0A225V1J6_9STRA|nr:RxLR effector protein [Phytophthora megakarya]
MRFANVILLVIATFLASTTAIPAIDSTQENSLTSTDHAHAIAQVDADTTTQRNLRVTTVSDEERINLNPIITGGKWVANKIADGFFHLVLKLWLWQNKSTKQVFGYLGLKGMKGRAVKNWKHKYWRQYVGMWDHKQDKLMISKAAANTAHNGAVINNAAAAAV